LLLGSSPTPGASDVGSSKKSTKMNKNKQREFVSKTKKDMVLQKSLIKDNNNNNLSSSNKIEELET
jgi:hypothetical protein